MIGRAGWWTQTLYATPVKPKNKILNFGLRLTSDDRPDWLMDSNPICHPSAAKRMKCSFLDYVRLLMIAWAGQWTLIRPPPLSSQKNKCSFLDYVQLLMIGWAGRWTQNPSATPLQSKKWNAHFKIRFNFWWSARLVNGFETHLPPLSSQKNEMLIFGLHWTSDDRPGWLMDSNPVCHPFLAKKIKFLFLDYVQLQMIGRAGRWTQNPSATPLQPKK